MSKPIEMAELPVRQGEVAQDVQYKRALRHLKLPDEPTPLAPARRASQSDLEFMEAAPADAI